MYAKRHNPTNQPLWKRFVDDFVARQDQLIMFAKSYSPECIICKKHLTCLPCVNDENFFPIEFEKRSDCSQIESYLLKLSGNSRREVPLFFLNGYFVGGYAHIISIVMQGRLRHYIEDLLEPSDIQEPRCPNVCGFIEKPQVLDSPHIKISTELEPPPELDDPVFLGPDSLRERASSLKKSETDMERALKSAKSEERMRRRTKSRIFFSPFIGDEDTVSISIASNAPLVAPSQKPEKEVRTVRYMKNLISKWKDFETSLEEDLGVKLPKEPSIEAIDLVNQRQKSVVAEMVNRRHKTVGFLDGYSSSEESDEPVEELPKPQPVKKVAIKRSISPFLTVKSSNTNVETDRLGREHYKGARKSMYVGRPGKGDSALTPEDIDHLLGFTF